MEFKPVTVGVIGAGAISDIYLQGIVIHPLLETVARGLHVVGDVTTLAINGDSIPSSGVTVAAHAF